MEVVVRKYRDKSFQLKGSTLATVAIRIALARIGARAVPETAWQKFFDTVPTVSTPYDYVASSIPRDVIGIEDIRDRIKSRRQSNADETPVEIPVSLSRSMSKASSTATNDSIIN